jgi:putative MATE family efflux protein
MMTSSRTSAFNEKPPLRTMRTDVLFTGPGMAGRRRHFAGLLQPGFRAEFPGILCPYLALPRWTNGRVCVIPFRVCRGPDEGPHGLKESGMQTQKANAITQNTIWKELLKYFFPIVLGTFFQQLYNIVDASIVGNFVGDVGLAAVGGTSTTIINLFLGFFVGLGAGATVVVAQHYGAEDADGTSRAVHTVVGISLAAGVIMMMVGTLLGRRMLEFLGTPDDVIDQAAKYLKIYFLGIESVLIFNIGSGILRAVGDSRRPLIYLAAGAVANIVMDLIFVGSFRMGVVGAAIATLLSQVFASALLVVRLMRVDDSYRLVIKKIGFDRAVLKDAFRIGLPSGLQSMMYGISNLLIQGGINAFGTQTMAAWSAYSKVDALFWMVINAFGISVTTFASQNYGARKMDRVRKSVRTAYLMAMCTALTLSAIAYVLAEPFLRIFNPSDEALKIGVMMVREITPLYFCYVSIEILSGALRGLGESFVPMIITVVGICMLRIAWLYGAFPLNPTVGMLVFGYPVTWATTSLMFILYYVRGGWRTRLATL